MFSSSEDFVQQSEALKLINCNIKSSANEKITSELIKAKIFCLINLNKFTMAIYTIKMAKKYKRIPESSFIFETVYCHYRLSKFDFALRLIKEHISITESNNSRFEILEAQILYRLERFNESAEIYQKLLGNNEFPNQQEEIKVNLLAAQAQARLNVKVLDFNDEFTSFETTYNTSIAKFFANDHKTAQKYSNHCEEIFLSNRENLSSSDLINSKIVSICSLAAENKHENIYEAETLFKKLLTLENKSSLQSDIINANLVFIAIKTGNLQNIPKIDTKKLDSLNLFNYQKNQMRSNMIQCENEQNNKIFKESLVNPLLKKTQITTNKKLGTVNQKKLDQERWIPLRDRTTFKPKAAYLKSKHNLIKSFEKSSKSNIKK